MILVIIASGLLIVDQITKFAVRSRMEIGETLPVFRGVLDITYVQNRGAAFSLFRNSQLITVILPIITILAGIAFLVYLRRNNERVAELPQQSKLLPSCFCNSRHDKLTHKSAPSGQKKGIGIHVMPVTNIKIPMIVLIMRI